MIILTNAEKRTVEGRGVILAVSLKANKINFSDLKVDGLVGYNGNNYRIGNIEGTTNLFHGGIGDMVGLEVAPVTYEVDSLLRIVYVRDEKSDMYTAFVQEIPSIITEGRTRGEARKRILEMMLTPMPVVNLPPPPLPPMERIIRECRNTFQLPSPNN